MSFEDWVANFTCVSLCPVGAAPVPVEEEDPEDEDVDQDALSSEEEDPFSTFPKQKKSDQTETYPGKIKKISIVKGVAIRIQRFEGFGSNTYNSCCFCCRSCYHHCTAGPCRWRKLSSQAKEFVSSDRE